MKTRFKQELFVIFSREELKAVHRVIEKYESYGFTIAEFFEPPEDEAGYLRMVRETVTQRNMAQYIKG